ncbi:protein of unknown function [Pseudomonas sp. JV551A1]|uniref:Uncharacterized protein n=1 Tax=Pseudomonas inefficax TaxID=2078786 RepID=A0AAQ1PCQ6_9PSED|nr:protein of unknown function [Pseudomonas sp. JV551A1]SPO61867.1 protein of unknown function [Pseudomonas inefficax]
MDGVESHASFSSLQVIVGPRRSMGIVRPVGMCKSSFCASWRKAGSLGVWPKFYCEVLNKTANFVAPLLFAEQCRLYPNIRMLWRNLWEQLSYSISKGWAIPVRAGMPANTGVAGAMHRVRFFAAKAAPTGEAGCLQLQLSARQRSPKGWMLSAQQG